MPFLISILPSVLPVIIGILAIRRLTVPFKLVLLQIILSLSVHITCSLLVWNLDKSKANNIWVYNLFVLPDFWLQCAIAILLSKEQKATRIIIALSVLHLGAWIWNIYAVGWLELVNWAYLVANIILVGAYLSIIIKLITKTEQSMLYHPMFLLCAASILYNCCSIPYLAMFNVLNHGHRALSNKLINILDVLDAIRLLTCGWTFILVYRTQPVIRLPSTQ